MKTFVKDPDAVLDYVVKWGRWLGSDTISTSTWIVSGNVTVDSDSTSSGNSTVWLSGGTDCTDSEVTNRIVTTGGRTNDRTIVIQVRNQ